MAPKTKEQYNEIRETTKARIKNEALKLFAENGYHSSSISIIAKKANISKGLMYNYFDNKEDLLKQIIFSGFAEIIHPDLLSENEPITNETFNNLIHEMFITFKKKVDYWKLYYSVLLQASVFKLVEKEIFEMAIPIFDTLGKHFYTKGCKNPEVETRMIAAMLDGIALNFIMDSENFPIDAVEKRILEIFK